MKVSKRYNAFTLVELLATLVILGILMSIAVAGYNIYIQSSSKTYYQNLEKTTEAATIEFFSDNRNYLPKNIGDVKRLDIQDLVNNHYIEKIVDTKSKQCTGYGVVQKIENGKYEYRVCIKCPSYNGNQEFGNGCDLEESDNGKYTIRAEIPSEYPQGIGVQQLPTASVWNRNVLIDQNLAGKPSMIDTDVPHNTEYSILYEKGNIAQTKTTKIVDQTKPQTPTITAKLEDGRNYTEGSWTSSAITLTISGTDWTKENLMGSGIAKFQVSTNQTDWEDVSSTTRDNIASGNFAVSEEGDHTYYIRSIDHHNNISNTSSFAVKMDKTPPVISKFIATSTASYNNLSPKLTIEAHDNVTPDSKLQMCISNTGYGECSWEAYNTSKNWTVSGDFDGSDKTIYIQVKDELGNIARTTTTYKLYNNQAPTISTFTIKSTNTNYNALSTTLTIAASDDLTSASNLKMCISTTGYGTGCTWESYKTSKAYTFTGSLNGTTRTLYLQVKDELGAVSNKSATYVPYTECSTVSTTYGSWSACPVSCGDGSVSRTYTNKDTKTGKTCKTGSQSSTCSSTNQATGCTGISPSLCTAGNRIQYPSGSGLYWYVMKNQNQYGSGTCKLWLTSILNNSELNQYKGSAKVEDNWGDNIYTGLQFMSSTGSIRWSNSYVRTTLYSWVNAKLSAKGLNYKKELLPTTGSLGRGSWTNDYIRMPYVAEIRLYEHFTQDNLEYYNISAASQVFGVNPDSRSSTTPLKAYSQYWLMDPCDSCSAALQDFYLMSRFGANDQHIALSTGNGNNGWGVRPVIVVRLNGR